MFIKKCDFKFIKILAKCDTCTEYCCHFTITCFGKMQKCHDNANLTGECKFKRKNANLKEKTQI
jgi:hypothetical protein